MASFSGNYCSMSGCNESLDAANASGELCWSVIGGQRVYFCSRYHRTVAKLVNSVLGEAEQPSENKVGDPPESDASHPTPDSQGFDVPESPKTKPGKKEGKGNQYKPRGMYRPRMPRLMSSNAARAIYWSNVIMSWLGKGEEANNEESAEHYTPKTSFPNQAAPSIWDHPRPPPSPGQTPSSSPRSQGHVSAPASSWRANAQQYQASQQVHTGPPRGGMSQEPIDAHWDHAKRNLGLPRATSTSSASGMASLGGPKELAEALRKTTSVIEKLIEHLDKADMGQGKEKPGTSMVPFGAGGQPSPPPGMQVIARRKTIQPKEGAPSADLAARQIGNRR